MTSPQATTVIRKVLNVVPWHAKGLAQFIVASESCAKGTIYLVQAVQRSLPNQADAVTSFQAQSPSSAVSAAVTCHEDAVCFIFIEPICALLLQVQALSEGWTCQLL